jgi:hypothetical protein
MVRRPTSCRRLNPFERVGSRVRMRRIKPIRVGSPTGAGI